MSTRLPAHLAQTVRLPLTRRQALAGLGAGAMAAALAACAGAGEDSSGAVTLTYLSWQNEETSRPLIDAFEQANPGIRIDFSYSPPVAEYFQTLQTRIAGGQQPDIHCINPETRANLIGEELVADLSAEPFAEALAEANRNAYSSGTGLYGASFGAWAAGVVYNKSLLEQAGFSSVPQSWGDFLDMCKELKDKGITPYRESLAEIPGILAAFLGARYEKAGQSEGERQIFIGETTFAKEWTPAVTQWSRLYTEGIVGTEAVSLTADQVRDDFLAGNTAMFVTGPWNFARLTEAGLDWALAPVPALADGQPYVAGAADPGIAVASRLEGAKKEAALKFVSFLASQEGLELQARQFGAMINTADYSVEVVPQYEGLYEDYVRQSRYYLPMSYWDKAPDALQIEAQAQLQQLVQGQVSPEQVGQALDRKLASL
ncbi:ABC transporter substrate-binding protein [Actinomyces faecalis]|uniref:ABC transporter substrate-binding protein n=1 Tax=Actinomyces faecalis TaxID=2722820 RepID=UPI001554DB62|nr:extracellular solute-binding protein [Actinomyces faecalis]